MLERGITGIVERDRSRTCTRSYGHPSGVFQISDRSLIESVSILGSENAALQPDTLARGTGHEGTVFQAVGLIAGYGCH